VGRVGRLGVWARQSVPFGYYPAEVRLGQS